MSMEPASCVGDKDRERPEALLNDKRDMVPASDRPINDDDDDKTEPVPEQLTRTSSGEPDAKIEEDYAREPADLSAKSKKEVALQQRPFRLDPEDVARFSRDPAEWLKTFRVPVAEKGQQQSREPEDDKRRLKPVDYTTLNNNNNNNNIVQQLLGQQLLGNSSALDDSEATSKKKRSRSKKRRSGSDVTNATNGVATTSGGVVSPGGAASGAPSSIGVETNSPPVVLDVVCGQNQASLSLEKLKSGSKTACVQLNGVWLTPNQYQHVSGRGTARDWKRSIKHNGTSLKALLASKVLTFDPPSCRCNLCTAISSQAKQSPRSIVGPETGTTDQHNDPPPPPSAPPRGFDAPPSAIGGGGGARTPSPLSRTSKQPTPPTIVCARSRDSAETEDYEEEEEDEEEEEEMERQKEEEDEEEEEAEEEEEDWERKRVLMDALSLKERPTTTMMMMSCLLSADHSNASRKRIAQQGDVRVSKKKARTSEGLKEKRVAGGGSVGLTDPGKAEKVRRNSENDAVIIAAGSSSSSLANPWTMLKTSGPSDLCRALSSSSATGATSSLGGAETFKATVGEVVGPSLQKEETLTHIIHELRNYKKSLEEKIVASRRTSHVTRKEQSSSASTHPLQTTPHFQWSSTGKDGPQQMFHQRVSGCSDKVKIPMAVRKSTSEDGCGRKDCSIKGTTKLEGSDEKQLPDLVRSHNPSTNTTTTSSPAGLSATTPKTPFSIYPSFTLSPLTSTTHYSPIARGYVLDPLTGAKYDCDEHGVIDLSIGKKHPTSSNLARPIYSTLMGKMELNCDADSDCERVLDLSMTSKVKVEHRMTPRSTSDDHQKVQKRKRLSDGHSRRPVQKRHPASTLSPAKILAWTVTDVVKFVADVPECTIYAETFKQFGVTGPSLVCLSVDQMTAILRMRLNAAQSLRSAVDRIVASVTSTTATTGSA